MPVMYTQVPRKGGLYREKYRPVGRCPRGWKRVKRGGRRTAYCGQTKRRRSVM